jgi:hypothetical protein
LRWANSRLTCPSKRSEPHLPPLCCSECHGWAADQRCLLSQETTVIVSMVFSRSKVLEKEVFLFQRLDAERRGQMLHLKVGRRLTLP